MNQRWIRVFPVLVPFLAYALASLLSHTLLYTVVTYLVSQSTKTGMEFSNTINEISSQYLLFTTAVGGVLVSLTIWQADRALYRHVPFWNDAHRPVWRLDHVRKEELLRGISSGALAALVFLVFFAASAQINYLGFVFTSIMGTPIFPLFFLDLLSVVTLVACEEFLFRHKILRGLLGMLPPGPAIVLTGALHVLARHLQFPLETFDYVNLFSVNLALGFFFVKSGKCQRGLGFLLSLTCMLHNFAGLLLWGNESPSLFLFKGATKASSVLTGGASGPFGGAGLTGILLLFALGSYLTWKRERDAKRFAQRQS